MPVGSKGEMNVIHFVFVYAMCWIDINLYMPKDWVISVLISWLSIKYLIFHIKYGTFTENLSDFC